MEVEGMQKGSTRYRYSEEVGHRVYMSQVIIELL